MRMALGLCQGLRRAVQLRGDAVAVICGEQRFTWHAFVDRVARLAAAFRALGVEEGDRVTLLAMNSHRSLEVYFAALWAGGVIVPLNHRLSMAEIALQIEDAEPVLLVAGPDFADLALRLAGEGSSIRAVVLADDGSAGDGLRAYETLIADAAPIAASARGGDDLACLFYTGGTTGRSKGVMLSHGNILSNSMNFIAHMALDESIVHLQHGPLFHVAAGARLFSVTQLAGTHVMLPRFEPEEVLRTIERHRVSIATFVPTMLRAMLDHPALDRYDLSSMRFITYGAAPTPATLLREAMTRFSHVSFVQSYGMTETAPVATMTTAHDHRSDDARDRLRSAGRAVMTAEIGIVDGEDRFQPAGTTGEIVIKGPMVMLGYWRQPEASAVALRGGWMHTGDIGYLDADGYLFVVDRLKDMIITGGENVYSQEVEDVLVAYPGVRECAVFGRPDPLWGEAVHAVVVPHPGQELSEEMLIGHCRARLGGFKTPKTIEIRHDRLPLSGANKILKSALRAELLARETA